MRDNAISYEHETGADGLYADSRRAVLSHREGEVLSWLAGGKTDGEIAQTLSLSLKTVNHHVEHILAKLDANNRTHAVTIAIRLRLIHIE